MNALSQEWNLFTPIPLHHEPLHPDSWLDLPFQSKLFRQFECNRDSLGTLIRFPSSLFGNSHVQSRIPRKWYSFPVGYPPKEPRLPRINDSFRLILSFAAHGRRASRTPPRPNRQTVLILTDQPVNRPTAKPPSRPNAQPPNRPTAPTAQPHRYLAWTKLGA